MPLTLTPKSYTYRKYSADMKRLKVIPIPLTKDEHSKCWDQDLYKAEKERCYKRIASKINTPFDYLSAYVLCMQEGRYEVALAITEVLKEHNVSTLQTHKYINQ